MKYHDSLSNKRSGLSSTQATTRVEPPSNDYNGPLVTLPKLGIANKKKVDKHLKPKSKVLLYNAAIDHLGEVLYFLATGVSLPCAIDEFSMLKDGSPWTLSGFRATKTLPSLFLLCQFRRQLSCDCRLCTARLDYYHQETFGHSSIFRLYRSP